MARSAVVFVFPPFQNAALLQQALTHSSFANEQPNAEHNERLEFLGDAILNFLSGDYLYQRYPNRPEGDLSQIREALVDEAQLCYFAKKVGIGPKLRLGKGALQKQGRSSPRLLCSAFEALVGAYFLDGGKTIPSVQQYVLPMFDSVIEQVTKAEIKNEKSRLQEWAQRRFGEPPEYMTISSSGPDHNREFLVDVSIDNRSYGQGCGHSKKDAQKAAARAALKAIETVASSHSKAQE